MRCYEAHAPPCRLLACAAITLLLGGGASGQDLLGAALGADAGVSEQAQFIHKWAATLAVLALQTNDNNLPGAQATIGTIQDLTLQACSLMMDKSHLHQLRRLDKCDTFVHSFRPSTTPPPGGPSRRSRRCWRTRAST